MPKLSKQDSNSPGNNINNWQMGSHETEKILYIKGNFQLSEEAAHRMEKIPTSNISDKGVVSRIYKELIN